MKVTRWEFRFRVLIISLLYFLGFFAPWERFGTAAVANPPRLWSWLALQISRLQLLPVEKAYLAVTVLAVLAAALGAWMRVWGTAYLGQSTMRNTAMQAGRVVASGPYRHLRNPLYLGMMLTSLAVAVLMPVSGAVLFLAAIALFTWRLIGGERVFLTEKIGERYLEYRRAVPSLWPSLRARVADSDVRPHWLQSVIAEFYAVGTAVSFAALAWSYDGALLIRCVLISFGISLVLHAFVSVRTESAVSEAPGGRA